MMILTTIGVLSVGAGLMVQYWTLDTKVNPSSKNLTRKQDIKAYTHARDEMADILYQLEAVLGIRDQQHKKIMNLTRTDEYNHPERPRFSHEQLTRQTYHQARRICQNLTYMREGLSQHQHNTYCKTDFLNKYLQERISRIQGHLSTYRQMHMNERDAS